MCSLRPPVILPTPHLLLRPHPPSSCSCLGPPLPSPPPAGTVLFQGSGCWGAARASISGHSPLSRPGAHPHPHFPSHPCIPTTELGLISPLTVRDAHTSGAPASSKAGNPKPNPSEAQNGTAGAGVGGAVLRPSVTFPLMSALLGSRHLKGGSKTLSSYPLHFGRVSPVDGMVAPSPSGALHPSCTGL